MSGTIGNYNALSFVFKILTAALMDSRSHPAEGEEAMKEANIFEGTVVVLGTLTWTLPATIDSGKVEAKEKMQQECYKCTEKTWCTSSRFKFLAAADDRGGWRMDDSHDHKDQTGEQEK